MTTTLTILGGLLWSLVLGVACYYKGKLRGKAETEKETIKDLEIFNCVHSQCKRRKNPNEYLNDKLVQVGLSAYLKSEQKRDAKKFNEGLGEVAEDAQKKVVESICNDCFVKDACEEKINGLIECTSFENIKKIKEPLTGG